MQAPLLFDLAFRQNDWLAERQSVIASNIANANTPGYKSKDLVSFEHVMEEGRFGPDLKLATTHPAHLSQSRTGDAAFSIVEPKKTDRLHSGNDVNVEQEFFKSGEVMRNYSLNSQIIKAFHRMQLASTKV